MISLTSLIRLIDPTETCPEASVLRGEDAVTDENIGAELKVLTPANVCEVVETPPGFVRFAGWRVSVELSLDIVPPAGFGVTPNVAILVTPTPSAVPPLLGYFRYKPLT
jgi:hypothetical protein